MAQFSSDFIPTDFGTKAEALIVAEADLVSLGFYEQDGVTYHRATMTPEAAIKIGKALEAAGHTIIGHRWIERTS